MGILLAFAPFIAFAVIDRLIGSTQGLIAGAVVSAALIARDWLGRGKSPKILEIGSMILFGALALYAVFGTPSWSIMAVRLRVDAGLLLIVLVSLAVRQPFTMQYARETVPSEFWNSPEFLRTNDVITGVWALAFLVMVIADLVLVYVPAIPQHFGIVATVLALVGAVKFTSWYPDRGKTESAPR